MCVGFLVILKSGLFQVEGYLKSTEVAHISDRAKKLSI